MPIIGWDAQLVVFAVWGLLVLCGLIAGTVSIVIAGLGRPGGMLIGGVVLGAGLAVSVAMMFSLPRYWWVGVLPTALGIQSLRMWRAKEDLQRRWTIRLSTIGLMLVTISALLAGYTSLQRQIRRERQLGADIEAAGGYVVPAFDGAIKTVLVRNLTAEALEDVAPTIVQLREVTELGLEGTACTATLLAKFAVLPRLQNLGLQSTPLTGDLGPALAQFKNVRVLDLMKTDVDDEDLPHLANLRKLERLYLHGTKVTEEGMERLRAKLPEADISGD